MVRLTLLVTGVLSLIYFLKPQFFSQVKPAGDKVLGIETLNQAVNIETVKTALTIFCINQQSLPGNLNELYSEELSKDKYIDLDKIFFYKPSEDCEFELRPK